MCWRSCGCTINELCTGRSYNQFLKGTSKHCLIFKVYIEIEDVNDNVPLTEMPVYYPSIKEGSPPKSLIIKLNATDDDIDDTLRITFKIISGNPEGFFEINKTTGMLNLVKVYLIF